MSIHSQSGPLSVLGAVFLLSACGAGGEADSAARAAEEEEACRTMPPAELSPSGHGCALAAEMRAVGAALATVTDQPSADRAAVLLRKSAQRLKALRTERLKLNDDPKAGAKGAMVGMHMPSMSAASRVIVDETLRISKEAPNAMRTISAAMEGMEF